MKKIPTIFKKDDKGKYCLPEWHGKVYRYLEFEELVPLRKYDGTPVYFDGTTWFYRRMLKNANGLAPEAIVLEHDEHSGRTICWMPVDENYNFKKYLDEALTYEPFDLDVMPGSRQDGYIEGSYELFGPKINGNPEHMTAHRMILHRNAPQISNVSMLEIHNLSDQEAYDLLKDVFNILPIEGVVFYTKNRTPVAKLRVKDFNYDE